jgi:hypothetical protein
MNKRQKKLKAKTRRESQKTRLAQLSYAERMQAIEDSYQWGYVSGSADARNKLEYDDKPDCVVASPELLDYYAQGYKAGFESYGKGIHIESKPTLLVAGLIILLSLFALGYKYV